MSEDFEARIRAYQARRSEEEQNRAEFERRTIEEGRSIVELLKKNDIKPVTVLRVNTVQDEPVMVGEAWIVQHSSWTEQHEFSEDVIHENYYLVDADGRMYGVNAVEERNGVPCVYLSEHQGFMDNMFVAPTLRDTRTLDYIGKVIDGSI